MNKLMLAAFAAIMSVSAHAQVATVQKPVVDVYTPLPVVGTGGQIAVNLVRVLNTVQNEREYRLGVIQGAQGDVAMLRTHTEAQSGKNIIAFTGVSTFTFNGIENPDPGFDRQQDFILSTGIGKNTLAIMVHPQSPFKDIKDLVNHIKNKNGETFMASTLTSPASKMLNDIFMKQYGIPENKVKVINYKTTPEIKFAIENKEADYSIFTIPEFDQLKFLAVSSPKRLSNFPNVPTGAEVGFKEFTLESILLFAVPKANGKFLTTFEADMKKVCESPEFEPIAKIRAPHLSYCMSGRESSETVRNELALINRTLKK
jgi:tripartite-type tricarboxylate transporter receptor subunit TctC